jgi:hypothetical protein
LLQLHCMSLEKAPKNETLPANKSFETVKTFKDLYELLGDDASEAEQEAYNAAVSRANSLVSNPANRKDWEFNVFLKEFSEKFPELQVNLLEALARCIKNDTRPSVIPEEPLW